jgi:hypothetical protein
MPGFTARELKQGREKSPMVHGGGADESARHRRKELGQQVREVAGDEGNPF